MRSTSTLTPENETGSAESPAPYSAARLVAVTALLIGVLALAFGAILSITYREAVRQEMVNLRNVSIAFSAQTLSVTHAVDQAMGHAERAFHRSPASPRIEYFDYPGTAQNHVSALYLFDARGRLLASAPAQHTRALPPPPAHKDGQLHIGIRAIDAATGRGVIEFSRSMFDQSGRPVGSVLAQVDSDRFERLYTLLELGKGGSVTLFHRDGTMLVRGPHYPAGIGRSFAHTPLFTESLPVASRGTLDIESPLDGTRRLYGYDAVSDYPLVIITGVDKAAVLDDWRKLLWSAAAFLLLLSLALALLCRRILRDSKRQAGLIGKLEASERHAERSAQYRDAILNAARTPIWVLDRARTLVMYNGAFRQFVGGAAEDLAGMPEDRVLDPGSAQERERRYQALWDGAPASEAITEIRNGAGEPRMVIQLTSRLNDAAGETQLVNVLTDITERHQAEAHLAYLANFDALTDLPNLSQFRRVLDEEVARASARTSCLGAFVVSLERAHEITDLLGHEAGDAAVRQMAGMFRALLPKAAAVARIKSAEFAVAVHAQDGCSGLEEFASALLRQLSEPLTLSGRDFYLAPVIGVSVFPQDGVSADELYRRAESARNRARDDGGEAIRFFSPRTHSDLDQRLTVEAQLRRALERNELRMLYQPKVNVASGQITGFEALLRWDNALLGEISPGRFIPIAERTGLIIPIGAWALEQVCAQIQRWSTESNLHVKVAVNLAPRQFHQQDLLALIADQVQRHALRPGSLEIEITETALMSREQEVDQLMHGIRRLGVELSIDDFGTGYSSLAYLKRFPVQRLKIDRAFIRDLGFDEDSAAIAQTIVNLARGLKLTVVAEGVESEGQLELLRAMHCDEYQGFLFSPPVEADEVVRMTEENAARVKRRAAAATAIGRRPRDA